MVGIYLSLVIFSFVSCQITASNLQSYCNLQPDAGSPLCSFNLDRFFYNTTSKECESFKYTGNFNLQFKL